MGQQSDSDLWPVRQADHAFSHDPGAMWLALLGQFRLLQSTLSCLPPNGFETHPSSSLLI